MASTRSLRPASSAHPSHLYRSYPKLGIAGRHQLRDLIDQAMNSQRGTRPVMSRRARRRIVWEGRSLVRPGQDQ